MWEVKVEAGMADVELARMVVSEHRASIWENTAFFSSSLSGVHS